MSITSGYRFHKSYYASKMASHVDFTLKVRKYEITNFQSEVLLTYSSAYFQPHTTIKIYVMREKGILTLSTKGKSRSATKITPTCSFDHKTWKSGSHDLNKDVLFSPLPWLGAWNEWLITLARLTTEVPVVLNSVRWVLRSYRHIRLTAQLACFRGDFKIDPTHVCFKPGLLTQLSWSVNTRSTLLCFRIKNCALVEHDQTLSASLLPISCFQWSCERL